MNPMDYSTTAPGQYVGTREVFVGTPEVCWNQGSMLEPGGSKVGILGILGSMLEPRKYVGTQGSMLEPMNSVKYGGALLHCIHGGAHFSERQGSTTRHLDLGAHGESPTTSRSSFALLV